MIAIHKMLIEKYDFMPPKKYCESNVLLNY